MAEIRKVRASLDWNSTISLDPLGHSLYAPTTVGITEDCRAVLSKIMKGDKVTLDDVYSAFMAAILVLEGEDMASALLKARDRTRKPSRWLCD